MGEVVFFFVFFFAGRGGNGCLHNPFRGRISDGHHGAGLSSPFSVV